jgi:hypothetical protein
MGWRTGSDLGIVTVTARCFRAGRNILENFRSALDLVEGSTPKKSIHLVKAGSLLRVCESNSRDATQVMVRRYEVI